MNFARRQIASLLLVIVAGVAACVFAWHQQAIVQANARSEVQERELQHTQQNLNQLFAQAQHFLTRTARDPKVLEAIHTGAGAEVVHELAENKLALGFSAVMLHDRSTDTLYLSDAPSRPGEWYGSEAFVQKLYTDNPQPMAEIELRGKPTLLFAHPLRQEGSAYGVLILSFTLDEVLLQQIADLTRNAVRLRFQDGRELAIGAAGLRKPLNWPSGAAMQTQLEVQLPDNINGGASDELLWVFLALVVLLGISAIYNYWHNLNRSEAQLHELVKLLRGGGNIQPALNKVAEEKTTLAAVASACHDLWEHYEEQRKRMRMDIDQLHKSNESLYEQSQQALRDRDAALNAPRIKSEFLSRMGDEITTPMSSTMSILQLMSEHQLPKEEKDLLMVALRSARLLTDNLNNILDFSKLDAHMLQLRKQAFIVRELVAGVQKEFEVMASDKKLKLSCNINFDVPEQIINDENRVKQVLANLLGNAVRFTQEGEIGIYVDVWTKGDKKQVRFTVSDSGQGMPKEALQGIFDSFDSRSRLSNASFAGRLRLIVCRQLSELLGGEIGVSSEPGKGSRFWFTIAT